MPIKTLSKPHNVPWSVIATLADQGDIFVLSEIITDQTPERIDRIARDLRAHGLIKPAGVSEDGAPQWQITRALTDLYAQKESLDDGSELGGISSGGASSNGTRAPGLAPEERIDPDRPVYAWVVYSAQQSGFSPKQARSLADDLDNVDIEDPVQVFSVLENKPVISRQSRKDWYQKYTLRFGVNVPDEITNALSRGPWAQSRSSGGPLDPNRPKRYVAVRGEVMTTDQAGADYESGMSLYDATQIADRQSDRSRMPDPWSRPKYFVTDDGDIRQLEPGEDGMSRIEAESKAERIRRERDSEQRTSGKKYRAIGGQVVPLEDDEDGGTSWAVASAEASQQRKEEREERWQREKADRDETFRQMQMLNGKSNDDGAMKLAETLNSERLAAQSQQFQSQMQLMQQQFQNQLQEITRHMPGPRDPIAELEHSISALDRLAKYRNGEELDPDVRKANVQRQTVGAVRQMLRQDVAPMIQAFRNGGAQPQAQAIASSGPAQPQDDGGLVNVQSECPYCGEGFQAAVEQHGAIGVPCPSCGEPIDIRP